jgi:hypothetical protein
MTTCPRPSALWRHDPDDTEGRRLYRESADAAARAQLAYEKRWLRLKEEPKP